MPRPTSSSYLSGGARANYASDGGRSDYTHYTYDQKTGRWVPVISTTTPPSSPKDDPISKVPNTSTGKDTSSSVDSKTEADKEFIETEFNTLVGDLSVTPSKRSIRLRVNNTVELKGFGNYLSGQYFVSGIKRTISRDSGYSQTLTVLKNGFGDSLKKSSSEKTEKVGREETVEKTAPVIKVGDAVKIVGDATYTNGKPVPAWVKNKTLTVRQIRPDDSQVLLMPILSWTYTRYVQKV